METISPFEDSRAKSNNGEGVAKAMETSERPRILFVDDEPHVLHGLRRALRSHDKTWEMVFCDSPLDALAEQERRPFDVAVVDMRMPVMSGVELIRGLATRSAATVSIMLTGATDIESAISAINDGNVFRFYAKPCAADVLAGGIGQALTHGRPKEAASADGSAFGVATLNRLPMGVVVVDAGPRVLFMNSLGAEYLAGNEGLTVGTTGLCRASRPSESTELHRLVGAVIEAGPSSPARALSITRSTADRPLSVVVAPLATEPGMGTVAVLLISDPDSQALPSVDTVARLFDLTEAEARLALALSEGYRIEDAAESLGITLNSARTYLKRVFSKTEVTRQAELVRLILAAPTLLDLSGGRPRVSA